MLFYVIVGVGLMLLILLVACGIYLYKEGKASGKEIKNVFYYKGEDNNGG